jgi:hypothetical protein
VKNQEMLYGAMHYWEGPTEVTGTIGNKIVSGLGFMELVGYRSRYSNIAFVRELTKGALKVLVVHVKTILYSNKI